MSNIKLPLISVTLPVVAEGPTTSLENEPQAVQILRKFKEVIENPARDLEHAALEFERMIDGTVKGELSTATPDDIESLRARSEQREQAVQLGQDEIILLGIQLIERWKELTKEWSDDDFLFEGAAGRRWEAVERRWAATSRRLHALTRAYHAAERHRIGIGGVHGWMESAKSWMKSGDSWQEGADGWRDSAYEYLASGLRRMGYDVQYAAPTSAEDPGSTRDGVKQLGPVDSVLQRATPKPLPRIMPFMRMFKVVR